MLNIHIYPSPFTHESRILKEATTLSSRLGMTEVDLVGVATAGLPANETAAPGTTIHRLGPSKGKGSMKAPRHILWCIHALWFCLSRRPKVVNCHSLPVLPIGVLVKALTGAKLVYDAHELETETAGSTPRRRRLGRLIERACISFVDLLIVVSPGIEAWYREHYGITAVVTVLNTPNYRALVGTSDRLAARLNIASDRTIILYQGLLASARGIEELIDAAPLLRAEGYELIFMGYGPMAEALAEKSAVGDFHVHPAVSPKELLEYTSSAHIGLCLIQDTCLSYRLSLPNKMFEYLMARLPVVASALPEMRKVLESHGVGRCIERWDSMTILEAVRQVDAMRGPELNQRLGRVAHSYSWDAQEAAMLAAYQTHVLSGVSAP